MTWEPNNKSASLADYSSYIRSLQDQPNMHRLLVLTSCQVILRIKIPGLTHKLFNQTEYEKQIQLLFVPFLGLRLNLDGGKEYVIDAITHSPLHPTDKRGDLIFDCRVISEVSRWSSAPEFLTENGWKRI